MNNKFKKFTALILSTLMMITTLSVPLSAFADTAIAKSHTEETTVPIDNGTCGENVKWEFYENGSLYIYGEGNMSDDSIFYGSPWYNYQSKISSVIIEYGVTSIGHSSFVDCENLTSVTISESVTQIGAFAFGNCKNLTGITIPNSVTSIDGLAFYNCSSLSDISVPDGVTSIGVLTFGNCENLTSINVGTNNEYYSSQNGVLFNKAVTELIACPGGKSGVYTVPDSVSTIGDSAFYYCSNLTSIIIPDSVTKIENSAFSNCSGLTDITIPKSVSKIGDFALEFCKSLTDINVDKNNQYYSSQGGVLFNKEMTEIIIFPGGKAGDYTVSDSVTSIGIFAFEYCENLTNINVDSNNQYYSSHNGALFDKAMTKLIACPGGKTGSYTVPSSVTKIGDFAFEYCKDLTGITIPNSVSSIGINAFGHCSSLTDIIIPNSVSTVSAFAFEYCENLTSITIPNSVTKIENAAFQGCKSLTDITIPAGVSSIENSTFSGCSSLNAVNIPGSVMSIGAFAFKDCENLTGITIPNSVSSIGIGAFANCSNLTNIYFRGNKPSILFNSAFLNVTATSYYPAGNNSWDDVTGKKNYSWCGGTMTFVPLNYITIFTVERSYPDDNFSETLTYNAFYNEEKNLYTASDYKPHVGDKITVTVKDMNNEMNVFEYVTTVTADDIAEGNNSFGIMIIEVENGIADVIPLYFTESTYTDPDTPDSPDNPNPPKTYKKGDITADGKITASDALVILRAAVGAKTLTSEETQIADANGDGNITASDALMVLRYAVGAETNSDVGKIFSFTD